MSDIASLRRSGFHESGEMDELPDPGRGARDGVAAHSRLGGRPAPLVLPPDPTNAAAAADGVGSGGDSPHTPTNECTFGEARLILPQSAPHTPTKAANPYPSWKRGSTGSPYNIKACSTTPSPAGRSVERCRMDVLSCSREASTWALDAWTNSSAWRALCDVDHGRHKLIRIIMSDRARVFPSGNPVAFDPQFIRTNCYFVVWNTAERPSMEQALEDLKAIRQQQQEAVVLMMGCLLQRDTLDDTWDTERHAENEKRNVEAMLSNEALVTGNLTMSFARTSEDVETYVLQLLFKTLQTKLESSFFLQHQWIAAFYASSKLLMNIWSVLEKSAVDLEACMEALVSGFDMHIRLGIHEPHRKSYLSLVALLMEKGAPLDLLGVLRSAHPKAVDEIVFSLRCVENHALDLSGLKLPVINPLRITAAAELLHRVDVSHNQLERLPLEIFLLPNITVLKASHNHLQFLPAFPRWRCMALQILDVSNNEIISPLGSQDYNDFSQFSLNPADTSTATSMLNKALPYMTPLNDRNAITPTAREPKTEQSKLKTRLLGTLSGFLQPTTKTVKRTTCVPAGIFTMRNLTSVNLRANKLEELPAWVTVLPKLWSLDLRDNPKLHRLPPELARARGLFLLRVEGLLLSNPPARELARGSKAVVCYLRSQLKMSSSYRHMKLMVIGETAAGKTTLLTYLSGELTADRTHRDELLSTVGVSMGKYKCQRTREGRRDVSLPVYFQTLDFAGQHEYDSTHQCFFSRRAVYIGVFDVTRGYEGVASLRPWLMSIQACAPGCPVVLVGTHCDVPTGFDDNDLLAAAEQECGLGRPPSACSALGLPKVAGLFLVSGITGEGMDALKDAIYSEAVELTDPNSIFKEPYLQQTVPGSFLELQERLALEAEELKKNNRCPVINHEQLLEVVKRAPPLDIEDSEELSQACRFLNDVGILLHYEPPPIKKAESLYFIEPQWLSNALARIVTTRERSLAYRGLLSIAHLPLVFKDLLVPPVLYSGFMDLLETFEILVPLDKENTVYLVPALLPKQTEKLPVLGGACCVARIYSLAFIPAGLWTRLIARLVAFFDLQPASVATVSDEDVDIRAGIARHLSAPATPSSAMPASAEGNKTRVPRSLPTSPCQVVDRLEMAQSSNNFLSVVEGVVCTPRLQDVLDKRRRWHCWQNGGVFYLREPSGKEKNGADSADNATPFDSPNAGRHSLPAIVEDNFIIVQEGRNSNELVLFVQSTDRQHAAQLLSNTVSQLDTLLVEWYPGLCEDPCRVDQSIPCSNCMRLASQMAAPPATLVECSHLYTMHQCLEAVQGGLESLPCPNCNTQQKLFDIAPDLTLSDLPCEKSMGENQHMLLDRDERNCLGRGAFGEVYAGFWKGNAAAIKIILAEDTNSEQKILDLYQVLRDEADILSHLHHPRILTLLGVCLSPSAVVLELAPLGTLHGAISKTRGLPPAMTHRVIRQIAEGLQYLHDSNIIFRDLKPENVLVWSMELPAVGKSAVVNTSEEGGQRLRSASGTHHGVCIKLADYSLAKYASSSGTLLQAKGTEGYMAPEVLSGAMERRFAYDCKVDIFSLGVVLYECLVGERPFWKLSKWKFLEFMQEGQCPSVKKGLEGFGDERSVDEMAGAIEQDPLHISSNSSDGGSIDEQIESFLDPSVATDAVSLSSLYSLKTTLDHNDPDGVVTMSSLYSKVLYIKNKPDEESEGGADAEPPLDEVAFEDDTCIAMCFQPLLRQCLQPRSHHRPSAREVALQLALCCGATDESDTTHVRCETPLMHVAPDVVQSVSKIRRIWACPSTETRIVSLTLPEMAIKSAYFTNPASADGEEQTPASRFSAIACTPMPKRKGQRVSSGTLVWIATLSSHLLAFNAESMELEGHAKLPATVVSMCMLSTAIPQRRNSKESILLAVGLIDGRAAVMKVSMRESRVKISLWEQLSVTNGDQGNQAVTAMTVSNNRKTLWLTHGSKIIAVDVAQLSKVRSWESGHSGDFRGSTLRCLATLNISQVDSFTASVDGTLDSGDGTSSQPVLCSAARRCSTVRLWSSHGNMVAEIDCTEGLQLGVSAVLSRSACHVTCLYNVGRFLWLGTRAGYLLVYDLVDMAWLTVVRHHAQVLYIGAAHTNTAQNSKASASSVITCGQPLPSAAVVTGSARSSVTEAPHLPPRIDGDNGTVFIRVDLLLD